MHCLVESFLPELPPRFFGIHVFKGFNERLQNSFFFLKIIVCLGYIIKKIMISQNISFSNVILTLKQVIHRIKCF